MNNWQQTVEQKVIHELVLPEVSKLNDSVRKKTLMGHAIKQSTH